MPRRRKRYFRRHQKIQRPRWLRNDPENHHEISKNSQNAQPLKYRPTQRSLQEEKYRLSGLWVRRKQSPGSFRKLPQWTPSKPHPQTYLPTRQRTRLPPQPRHRPPRHQARKPTRQHPFWPQDMRFWFCSAEQKGEGECGADRLRGNKMVPSAGVVGGRIVWEIDRYVGSRLHNVLTDRWKSVISRIEWARPIIFDPENIRSADSRSARKVHQKSEVFGDEISINSILRSYRQKVLRQNRAEGSVLRQGSP